MPAFAKKYFDLENKAKWESKTTNIKRFAIVKVNTPNAIAYKRIKPIKTTTSTKYGSKTFLMKSTNLVLRSKMSWKTIGKTMNAPIKELATIVKAGCSLPNFQTKGAIPQSVTTAGVKKK